MAQEHRDTEAGVTAIRWEPVWCLIGPAVNLFTDIRRDERVSALTPHGWLVERAVLAQQETP